MVIRVLCFQGSYDSKGKALRNLFKEDPQRKVPKENPKEKYSGKASKDKIIKGHPLKSLGVLGA